MFRERDRRAQESERRPELWDSGAGNTIGRKGYGAERKARRDLRKAGFAGGEEELQWDILRSAR
jgi:hypothetical protein